MTSRRVKMRVSWTPGSRPAPHEEEGVADE